MRVYLSGKVSGLSKKEYTENFERAANLVREAKMVPVNPVEVVLDMCSGVEACGGEGEIHHWTCYMKHDIILLMKCDAIAVLPNWMDSSGAQIEMRLADEIGMPSYAITPDYSKIYEWRGHAE